MEHVITGLFKGEERGGGEWHLFFTARTGDAEKSRVSEGVEGEEKEEDEEEE